jgi:hypothetical protein
MDGIRRSRGRCGCLPFQDNRLFCFVRVDVGDRKE